jgi:hypothetical protein
MEWKFWGRETYSAVFRTCDNLELLCQFGALKMHHAQLHFEKQRFGELQVEQKFMENCPFPLEF